MLTLSEVSMKDQAKEVYKPEKEVADLGWPRTSHILEIRYCYVTESSSVHTFIYIYIYIYITLTEIRTHLRALGDIGETRLEARYAQCFARKMHPLLKF